MLGTIDGSTIKTLTSPKNLHILIIIIWAPATARARPESGKPNKRIRPISVQAPGIWSDSHFILIKESDLYLFEETEFGRIPRPLDRRIRPTLFSRL